MISQEKMTIELLPNISALYIYTPDSRRNEVVDFCAQFDFLDAKRFDRDSSILVCSIYLGAYEIDFDALLSEFQDFCAERGIIPPEKIKRVG